MTSTASLSSTPALMMDMDETIIDRIAFGGVKELEELYQ
jgi:predicted secreted acid phosphatase